MKVKDFQNQIDSWFESGRDRELKDFLLAMYPLLETHKDNEPSLKLVLEIIDKSLVSKAIETDPEWLRVEKSPSGTGLMRKLTAPGIKHLQNEFAIEDIQARAMEFTYNVIKFQVAELTRMTGKQLDNNLRSLGVISETGHDWYNFSALTVIECGLACMIDNNDDLKNIDWSFIGHLLEDGRIYE